MYLPFPYIHLYPSPAIYAVIRELAGAGLLNATTGMATGPSFAASAPALAAIPGLQAGLHLNFTESLGQPGLYLPVSVLIARTWLRRLNPKQLQEQIARQLDGFENVMGRAPDFVDGHQHVDRKSTRLNSSH